MPELPDITVYLEALESRVLDQTLLRLELRSPFVLRTTQPSPASLEQHRVTALRRLGKRIALRFDHGAWLVIHLMIAGRLHWLSPREKPAGGKNLLACLRFDPGTLTLTEAGTKRRASIHVVADDEGLRAHDPGGLEIATASVSAFGALLQRENHTLKRSLTDPHLFSGIGNAYSDEILHAARLSPVALTQKLSPGEIERLHRAVQDVLALWTGRLRSETAGGFPEKVTAFRGDMAVHGKFGKPCPDCGTTVQRIRYVENEVNYCPRCQTGGRILADRSLSRLLKKDWPRTIEEAEKLTGAAKPGEGGRS